MIAVIAVLTLVAAGRSTVSPQNGLDVRPVETTENPRIDVQVEFNPPPIDKQSCFPDRDGTETTRSAVLPATLEESAGGGGRRSLPLSSRNATSVTTSGKASLTVRFRDQPPRPAQRPGLAQ